MKETIRQISIYESAFQCAADCGAEIIVDTFDPDFEIPIAMLTAAGWMVISENEAYCPHCVEIFEKIAKIKMQKHTTPMG